ncbi:hypothetical protein CA602_27850 [Paraburkholderia hospita]|nr:hypothetical protein CA602_27850 [Paraburkholderia hospita]
MQFQVLIGHVNRADLALKTGWLFSVLCEAGLSERSQCHGPIVRISANVTADFGNVTDSAGLGVARC